MGRRYNYVPDSAKLWTDSQGRPIAVVEVTIRCVMGTFLLAPNEKNTRALLGVLGRAVAELDFELYGYAYLSDHGSMLVGVRSAAHLARIMEYVHGNIALELGRPEHSDWRGRFWGRRGMPILVLSDVDLEARLRYLLSNGTKENLVEHPTRWPGAHSARATCSGNDDVGLWVDRTGLSRALRRRMGPKVLHSDYEHRYPVHLSPLPCWAGLPPEERQRRATAMCDEIAAEAAAARAASGARVLGAKAAARVDPHSRAADPDRSPAPPVHCSDAQLRARFLNAYRLFQECYRAATDRLRRGLSPRAFPEGGVPIGCHFSLPPPAPIG
jgi:hypothetical protein